MPLCFSLLFNTQCKRTTLNFCVSSFKELQCELLFVLAATSMTPQDVFFKWWVCFLVMNSAWDKLSISKTSISLMLQVICCIMSCYIQDYEVMNSKLDLVIEGGDWQNGAQQLLPCGSINVPSLEFATCILQSRRPSAGCRLVWYAYLSQLLQNSLIIFSTEINLSFALSTGHLSSVSEFGFFLCLPRWASPPEEFTSTASLLIQRKTKKISVLDVCVTMCETHTFKCAVGIYAISECFITYYSMICIKKNNKYPPSFSDAFVPRTEQ